MAFTIGLTKQSQYPSPFPSVKIVNLLREGWLPSLLHLTAQFVLFSYMERVNSTSWYITATSMQWFHILRSPYLLLLKLLTPHIGKYFAIIKLGSKFCYISISTVFSQFACIFRRTQIYFHLATNEVAQQSYHYRLCK